ncbi:MAG: hypothetical protein BWY78_00381 [Alphaproteobacteria bacterium ADurb.Bin438]|nr:MAG: hypothetical protein BWY78_00381 [Alphaproteobacteria bacterium ADurb.Bin438]
MFKTGIVRAPKDLDEAFNLAIDAKPELDKFGKGIAEKFGVEYVDAPLKSRKRAKQKLETKYDGDITQLQDIARCKVICETLEDVRKVQKYLEENVNPHIKKDRIHDPNERGYRDLKYTFPANNGLLVETQITLRAFEEADKRTHVVYEGIRELMAKATEEKRPLSEEEQKEISLREKLCKHINVVAAQDYNKDAEKRGAETLRIPAEEKSNSEKFNELLLKSMKMREK